MFAAAERLLTQNGGTAEFGVVLQPVTSRAFVTGFNAGDAGIGPLALAEAPDGMIWVSGGPSRNVLYRYGRDGGDTTTPLITLPHPVYSLEFDSLGRLWATTGGGPLLQLNPSTGAIINQFGDGITLDVEASPLDANLLYVTTHAGVEKVQLETNSLGQVVGAKFLAYSRDRNLRFGSLDFAADGSLWAIVWPERNTVVRFNQRARAEVMFTFDAPVDSLAFGRSNSVLQDLLFVTQNNDAQGNGGDLVMIDTITRRQLNLAENGSRGDSVLATTDGRIFVSQSGQVDLLTAQLEPTVIATNPPDQANVALPLSLFTVRFDQEMRTGDRTSAGSVLNPDNYHLIDAAGKRLQVQRVVYDPTTNTVLLTIPGISPADYRLVVKGTVQTRLGVAMGSDYETRFTAIDSAAALVSFAFSNSRLERSTNTIRYDVTLTNKSDRPLVLPLYLVLNPISGYPGTPTGATQDAAGNWLLNLTSNVVGGVNLAPGASTTGRTVAINSPNDLRVNFTNSASATVGANAPPAFTSAPVTSASVGQPYQYPMTAIDPDGSPLTYVLVDGPTGMTLDASSGVMKWTPTAIHSVTTEVIVRVYDPQGAWAEQLFTIAVNGGNHPAVFAPFNSSIERYPGTPLVVRVTASDEDQDALTYAARNIPPGSVFDPSTRALYWLPTTENVGIYNSIEFDVWDGKTHTTAVLDLTVLPRNLPPTISDPGGRILREGDALRINLNASDPDGDAITYVGYDLPLGSTLHPLTGEFSWLPGYDQEGVYNITFEARAGNHVTQVQSTLVVLNSNAAPEFDPIETWRVYEGQAIEFRIFARDPDNPNYQPPQRLEDGSLLYPGGVLPTVAYTPTRLLPDGAQFDPQTGLFRWIPAFNQSGTYQVSFTATDDGDGVEANASASITIPIEVLQQNLAPVIPVIETVAIARGATTQVTVTVTDPDGDPITLSADSALSNRALEEFISFTDLGGGRGTFIISPKAGDRGSHPITLTARDYAPGGERWGRLTTSYDFLINVTSENDPPVMNYIGDRVAITGQPIEVALSAYDLDEENLQFTITGLPGATIVPGVRYGEALLRWTPSADGTFNATVTVTDSGHGTSTVLSASEQLTFRSRGANAPPTSPVSSVVSARENELLTYTIPASDADGDRLRFDPVGELPLGAKLDAKTGVLTWTPGYNQAGQHPVKVAISDGNKTTQVDVTIDVVDTNQPPIIIGVAPQFAREGAAYRLLLSAIDPDVDSLTVSIDNLPAGAVFDTASQIMTWIPGFDQSGLHNLVVRASDGRGGSDSMPVRLRVDDVNRSPVLQPIDRAGVVGQPMRFTLTGSDPDLSDQLTFGAVRLPEGATLNPTTGEFNWTPVPGQASDYVVTFTLSDGVRTVRQTSLLRVTNEVVEPLVHIEFTPSFPTTPGQDVQVRVTGSSLVGIKGLKLYADGQQLQLDAQGRAVIRATATGQISLEAVAEDNQSVVGRQVRQLKVRDPNDNAPPTVELNAQLTQRAITARTDIVGRIADVNLDSWTLSIAPWGSDQFVELASSTHPVDGTLAAIDPARWANGVYQLRLVATDISGRVAKSSSKLEINSSNKSGVYIRAERDDLFEKSGASLALTRVYDSSLVDFDLSFGSGWRWAELDFVVQTDAPLTGREAFGDYSPLQDGSRLYASLIDGRRVGFTFTPEAVTVGSLTYYRPRWQSDAGAEATLNSIDAMLRRVDGKYYDLNSGLPYHPSNELLSGGAYSITPEGLPTYHLDAHGRTTRIEFGPGCAMSVSDSQINGNGINYLSLLRDSSGRITRVSSTDGGYREYVYNASGSLNTISDQDGLVSSSYAYSDDGKLQFTATKANNVEVRYAGAVVTNPIAQHLGNVRDFSSNDFTFSRTAAEQRFTVLFAQDQLQSSPRGEVMLQVVVEATNSAAPIVVLDHATPVSRVLDGKRATSLFIVNQAGLDMLRVTGTEGSYTLKLRIAGDLNADAQVDANDGGILQDALTTAQQGLTFDPLADINGDGNLDYVDRLSLLYSFGFTTSAVSFALPSAISAVGLEPGSDDSIPLDDNMTSLAQVAISGVGKPFEQLTLAPSGQTATSLLNGMFAFFDVPLKVGPNDFTVGTDTGFGSVGTPLTVTRLGSETTPPKLTFTLKQDSGPNDRDRITNDPTLVGAALDVSGIDRVELSFDGGLWKSIPNVAADGSFELTTAALETILGQPLADGKYSLRVRAYDALQNVSETLAFSFVLDTTQPQSATDVYLVAESDTGTSNSDRITNKRDIVISASADIGDRIEVRRGGVLLGSQLSTGMVTIPIELPGVGVHDLVVSTWDEAGNRSELTSTLSITVDQTAPTSVTAGLSTDTDTGTAGDNQTSLQTVSLVGQTDPNTLVAVYRSGSERPFATATSSASGTYRIDGIDLAAGSNDLVIASLDIAGNAVKTTLSVTTTANDTLAPRQSMALRRDTGRSVSDKITNDGVVLATIDDPSGVASVMAALNGQPAQNVTAWLTGSQLEFTLSRMASLLGANYADGNYSLQLTSTDSLGHASAATTLAFTLDTSRPTPPSVLDLPAASDSGVSSTDNITNKTSFALSTTAESNSIVRLYQNGTLQSQTASTGSAQFDLSGIADGTHFFTATAEDISGNVSNFALPLTIIIDRDAPGITSLKLSDRFRDSSNSKFTSFEHISLEGQTEANAWVEVIGTNSSARANAIGSFILEEIPLVRGENRLEIRVSDLAGNVNTGYLVITMEDRNGPEIKISLSQDTGSSTTDLVTSNPAINGFVRDASGVTQVEIMANSGPWLNITNHVANGFFDFSSSSIQTLLGASLADGKNLLSIRAQDGTGLSLLESMSFVLDRSAPAIIAPRLLKSDDLGLDEADHVINSTSVRLFLPVMSSYEVDWYRNSILFSSGNVDSNGFFTLAGLPDGINTFTAEVRDSAGNISARSLPISITVDTSIPTILWGIANAFDTGTIGDRRTDNRVVRVEGQTEPNSLILLESIGVAALSDSQGVFFIDRLYLENGENVLDYTVTDMAGNTLENAVRFTYTGDPNDDQPRLSARGSQFQFPETTVATIYSPDVVDESYSVDAGKVLIVSVANGLIINDRSTNPSRPTLQVIEMDTPSSWHPVVTVNSDGSFVFDARQTFDSVPQGQTVTYELYYQASDGVDAHTGRALIHVRGENNAPVAVDDSGYLARTDRTLYVSALQGLLSNASDIDRNDRINVTPAESLSSKGAKVIVRADGSFEYDARQAAQILAQANLNPGASDSFTYEIVDRYGARVSAVVRLNVIGPPVVNGGALRTNSFSTQSGQSTPPSGLPPFEYIVVAAPGEYESIGTGISINNNNSVGFTAVQGASNAYFWEYGTGVAESVLPSILELSSTGGEPPFQFFGDLVSLNDSDMLLAQRVIAMNGLIDSGFNFLSPGSLTSALFSYVENWNTQSSLPLSAVNVANGDMGLTAAGVIVIDPLTWIAIKTVSFLAGGFGGLIGFGALAGAGGGALAGPFFTPINPVWAVTFPTKFKRIPDFALIYDQAIQNNSGKVVFQTQTTKRHGEVRFLATTIPDNGSGIIYAGLPIPDGNLQYDIADNGTIIVNNGTITSYSSNLSYQAKLSDSFSRIGKTVSISEDGSMVAFVGVGPKGTGVYMLPASGGQPQKLIGISEDGTLDPGETWEDKDGNGQFNGKEDVFGFLDLDFDAQVNIAKVAQQSGGVSEYFVQFAGSRVAPDLSSASYGLHLVKSPYLPTTESSAATVGASQISTVASVGQALANVGSVETISTNDGLSSTGHVAFVVNSNSIFVAQPPTLRAFVDSNNDDDLDPSPLGEDYLNRVRPGSPGRIVDSGIGDTDGDGVPDWRDGFDFTLFNSDDKQSTHQFQKLVVQIPDDLVVDSRSTIAFRYDSSDPAGISGIPLTGYTPDEGRIRLWKKDGNVSRDKEEDFLGSYQDSKFYTLSELGFSKINRTVEFFVEGIPILDPEVFLEPDFTLTTRIDVLLGAMGETTPSFTTSDSVNVTVVVPILRIDADNNSGFDLPDLTAEELSRQNPRKNKEGKYEEPGRIIVTSKSDSDGDGIPDFADGLVFGSAFPGSTDSVQIQGSYRFRSRSHEYLE